MYTCNICYKERVHIPPLFCCVGKMICTECTNQIKSRKCPFCRKLINKRAIIILNKNIKYSGRLIISLNNINVIQV